jgi:ankyrin repeat protein
MVERLIRAGAKVNATNQHGVTALMSACSASDARAITSLLAHGADVNKQTDAGLLAIHFAAERGHTNAVRALIAHKSNLSLRDTAGKSALDYALSGMRSDDHKASPFHFAPPNWHVATNNDYEETIKLLLDAGISRALQSGVQFNFSMLAEQHKSSNPVGWLKLKK